MVQLSSQSLSDFVRHTVTGFRNECEQQGISLELNIEDICVPYQSNIVRTAVVTMLESSISSMPAGGELEVNLIGTEFQWELEVADSGSRKRTASGSDCQSILEAVSLTLGGSVQTWNCPLGGLAHVLIVPKRGTGTRTEPGHRKAA